MRGREVCLRQPAMGDYAAWAELRALSRQHLTVWEPQWARDELSRSAFRRRLRQYQRELREDQGYAFLIFRDADATLLGGLSISNVRRGVAQAASVGYWIGAPLRRPRLHDGRRAGRRSPSPSARSACIGWRPPACRTTRPPRACSRRRASSARAWRGAT